MKQILALFMLAIFGVAIVAAPATAKPHHGAGANMGRHLGQFRHLQGATLPDSQIAYAFAHQPQSIARLRSMHTIDYSKIRIVRLTAAQRARFHVSLRNESQVAYQPVNTTDATVAQIFNSNNGLVNELQQIVAGLLITNAINRTLGGNAGGASATLAQVLVNSGIPLSSLLAVFFDPSGILNAIVG